MQIGFLGHGVFGVAIGSLVEANGYTPEYVDVDDSFSDSPDVLFLAVPVQYMRAALQKHQSHFSNTTVVINCSKGIELETGCLPHQIVSETIGDVAYAAVMGPSFASEIIEKMPTTVSVAGNAQAVATSVELLTRPFFVLEALGTVLELELAGAMKNIYAIASGFVSGSGGGRNTHAHVQVVALREYTALIHALEGNAQVVRPGVIGDLILTCGSTESRNFQYGVALAKGEVASGQTTEGVTTVESIAVLAESKNVAMPLAAAVRSLIQGVPNAEEVLYNALGFNR